jgi:hypothetical protein
MQTIYNSPNYCVVEFAAFGTPNEHDTGGFEIMDKMQRREIFLRGANAASFRKNVQELIENEPSIEAIDDFLNGFSALMTQPLRLH